MLENLLLPLIILLLTLASAFFSSSETALFSLSQTKVRAYAHSKDPRKKLIASLLDRPQDLLVTVFILNTVVNVLVQNAVSSYVGEEGSWILKVLVPFLILLFFGEVFPKQFGLEKNERLAHLVAPAVAFSEKSVKWIKDITVAITSPLSRALFFYLKKDSEITPEELKLALQTSQELGVLHPAEAELADGYLEMSNSIVRELMRPKEEILAYNLDEPLSKIAHLFVDQECSRLPVYLGSLDHVVGILSARTFFVYRDGIEKSEDLIPLLKKPFFTPETTSAKALFKQLEENREVFSLVVNEYGVITGLITKEDLIETVIGAIVDRRDKTRYYTPVAQDAIIAMGQMEMEEIEELYKTSLHVPAHVLTLGGWLTDRLGDIPTVGQTYSEAGLHFKVLAAGPNRVKKVYISRQHG